MRALLVLVSLTLPLTLAPLQGDRDQRESEARRRGRAATEMFYTGQAAQLWVQFDEAMARLVGSEENLRAMGQHLEAQLGAQTSIVKEELFPAGAGGKSHVGEGKRNEDYFCFAKPLLAPGAGKVVRVVDDIEDNLPGEMNSQAAAGNHVVLDHGNGEFSMLAHFKKGSIEAVLGDEVLAGDRLGLSGNSGNSSEPHIHYHLQTTPDWFKGEGLPSQFVDYLCDGEVVARGEPVKGQVIGNR